MQMIESTDQRLTSLILPSAALIIDTRGIDEEAVIDRLRTEIVDLVQEMKLQEIHHWRYLTDFMCFLQRTPMTCEDVNTLRPGNEHNLRDSQQARAATNGSGTKSILRGLTGPIDPSTMKGIAAPFYFQRNDDIASFTEDRPADMLRQSLHRFVQEIDRLRNNRHVAVADLDKLMLGRSIKDPTVRVIFLTDIERPDSLATAAVYAAHLKQFYAEKEREDEPPMISTSVICLNNSGSPRPASYLKELLWNDGWEHIDALILTEDYRQDAANIAGAVQAYVAELLLYILLTVPPLPIEPSSYDDQPADAEADSTTTAASSPDTQQDAEDRIIALPPTTYLVGLAAMEHSARWGRRLLNFRLVERAIEIMQRGVEGERLSIKSSARNWLENWRGQVKSAIPHKVPGKIEALRAIPRAKNAIRPAEKVFRAKNFNLNIGVSTIEDLQHYLDSLIETYGTDSGNGTGAPTLHAAIGSIKQIEQCIQAWGSKDPALRKGAPLVNAQVEAQRILSDPNFFTGVSGAISRARAQLEELTAAISDLRGNQELHPIELEERRKELAKEGTNKIDDLRKHIQKIPLLASVLRFGRAMAWGSFFITLFLGIITTFIGVAWLRHLIIPAGFAGLVNALLFPSVSPLAWIFWIIMLGIVSIFGFVLGRQLLDFRDNWRAEFIFWCVLLVFAFTGLIIVNLSYTGLAADPSSLAVISWMSFMPAVGAIALFIALLIGIGEGTYFFFWYRHLQEERTRIVDELNRDHQGNIEEVITFIADSIALSLLVKAGVFSESGGHGEYYQRINQVSIRLKRIAESAQKQQRLARKRLMMSVSETQEGAPIGLAGPSLNLRIRDEHLDMKTLADSYSRMDTRLEQEGVDLKEFAELALRIMGQEPAEEIEQEFRERYPISGSIEQHNASILMSTLLAMALRLSINATSIASMTPLIEQYDAIVHHLSHEPAAMRSLIDGLRKRLEQNMLQPVSEGRARAGETETDVLATNAFAAWSQILWEGKDAPLDRALSLKGVLPILLEEGNNAHMVQKFLGLRTSLFGRNIRTRQIGALYLLLPPSPYASQFSYDLNLPRQNIIDFPDMERLILLYVQHYAGDPLVIPASKTATKLIASNGSAGALPPAPATQSNAGQSQAANTPSTVVASAANGSPALSGAQLSPQPAVAAGPDQEDEDAVQASGTIGASVQPVGSLPTTAAMQPTTASPQANSGAIKKEDAPAQAINGSNPGLSPGEQPAVILDPGVPAMAQINAFSPNQSVDIEALPLPSFHRIEDEETDEEEIS
jgi:hypothetical protein